MKYKPVVAVDTNTMWDYEYQAKYFGFDKVTMLASNSLLNLKQEIRENTKWGLVWITAKHGCFSYGQELVDEYPYCPRR